VTELGNLRYGVVFVLGFGTAGKQLLHQFTRRVVFVRGGAAEGVGDPGKPIKLVVLIRYPAAVGVGLALFLPGGVPGVFLHPAGKVGDPGDAAQGVQIETIIAQPVGKPGHVSPWVIGERNLPVIVVADIGQLTV